MCKPHCIEDYIMKIEKQSAPEAVIQELGTRIARRRIERGMTQAEAAEQAGVGKRHGGLRHERAARLVLAVCVRDVEPHAAGAGGADLQVHGAVHPAQGPVQRKRRQGEIGFEPL